MSFNPINSHLKDTSDLAPKPSPKPSKFTKIPPHVREGSKVDPVTKTSLHVRELTASKVDQIAALTESLSVSRENSTKPPLKPIKPTLIAASESNSDRSLLSGSFAAADTIVAPTNQNYSLKQASRDRLTAAVSKNNLAAITNSPLGDSLKLLAVSKSKLKIFLARSTTLHNRIKFTVENVFTVYASETDLLSQATLNLLLVLVEEVEEYFKLLSQYSRETIEHLTKYGTDEELFCKWNERLQFIILTLSLTLDLDLMFSESIDKLDLITDTSKLREDLPSNIVSVLLVSAIKKKLASQENIAFFTVITPRNDIMMDPRNIVFDSIIGIGSYGTVWKARVGSQVVAVKKMNLNISVLDKEALVMEAQIMRQLSHPRIVACIGVFETETEYCMVLEYCRCGNLADLISNSAPIDYYNKLEVASDVTVGMNYLHRVNVIHRDLKPANVVFNEFGRAKIVDFGLAVTKTTTMTSFRGIEAGTPSFMAPESFGLVPVYSTKSDVFAFGVIMWELAHWQHSYAGVAMSEIRESIKAGDRLPIDYNIPDVIYEIIAKCWDQNPKIRPSFSDLRTELRALVGKKSDAELLALAIPKNEKKQNMTTAKSKIPHSTSVSIGIPSEKARMSKKNVIMISILFLIFLGALMVFIYYIVKIAQ